MSLYPRHPAGPPPPTPLPPPAPKPGLLGIHVNGAQLQTNDGQPTKLVGVADFAQFGRWLQVGGKENLVRPIINERTDLARAAGYLGPLTARVFRYAAPPNRFALDPWSYPMSAVTEFTQFYNAQGWYVDWTAGDAQLCFPSDNPHWGQADGPTGLLQHQNEFCNALLGTKCLWQTCNEPGKNGVDVASVTPPPWAPAVQTSGFYDDGPQAYSLTAINFHPDRSMDGAVPKFVGKLYETAVYLWPVGKPIMYDEIIGAQETNEPGRRCNDPVLWKKMGLAIAFVDGLYFHSQPGLASDGFGPIVKDCYRAFMQGIVAGLQA